MAWYQIKGFLFLFSSNWLDMTIYEIMSTWIQDGWSVCVLWNVDWLKIVKTNCVDMRIYVDMNQTLSLQTNVLKSQCRHGSSIMFYGRIVSYRFMSTWIPHFRFVYEFWYDCFDTNFKFDNRLCKNHMLSFLDLILYTRGAVVSIRSCPTQWFRS